MKEKIFYRVENPNTKDGLWYNQKGEFTGLIHSEKLNKLSNHNLKMPYTKKIVGYLSVAESIEDLKFWFNESDMLILSELGYMISVYESDDYIWNDKHFVINQKTSKRIKLIENY